MLYAMTRSDGSIALATMMPKEIIVDGKTLPITFVSGTEKTITAIDGNETKNFPLPSEDMRTYEVDSVPNAVLTFYDINNTIANSPEPIVSYEKITVEDVPDSRSYRNAWSVNGKTIIHDMPKARDVHRTKLREERKPLLETLDVAYQRADEQDNGPEKRRIAAEKQKLRDITANPLIERAADIDALKLLTVEYLLAHP